MEKDKIILSKRLKAIYDLVPNQVCSDIGADHGKLIISLVENNKIPYGYAVENKKGPYDVLCSEINKSVKKEFIKPIFSDGIKDLNEDVKTIVIAGMGGHLIIDILFKNIHKLQNVKDIILDPHNDIEFVRKSMYEIGFSLSNEVMVFENNVYYEILHFINKKSNMLDSTSLKYGPILLKEKPGLFIKKYNDKIKVIENILNNENISSKRRTELENTIKSIKEIL